jgi:non-heme chloroperoxidase
MPTITTRDGTQTHYRDWGTGQPIVFSHGWPLSADAWGDIAHDRRGHGRSSQFVKA